MKIRRSLIRTTASTQAKFYRHDVTLPAELVAELGWTHGVELTARKYRNGILLERKEK